MSAEEKKKFNFLIGSDTIISLATSAMIPYAIFEFAVKMSSYKGGPAISHALKAFGPGGVKGGIATLLLSAVTTYAGTQMILPLICEKVIEADYAKGEKTKEDLIDHINHLPISNPLRDLLIEKIKKLS
ncbi:hypothetical protein [Dehalobacter sp.]|uniref:hypothetical protein n=1 Tax=Dehalobacter sp. TaxID=1962289 RepID=UPI00258449DA|nr:hypothetical protein [Dehalobacter sp.]MDJ0306784.1 hypothetical protein [Dehalobacter sp.]